MMWSAIKEGKVLTDEEIGFIVDSLEFSN